MGGPINNAQFNARRSQVVGDFERAAGNLHGPPQLIGSMTSTNPRGSTYEGLRYPGGTVDANWRDHATGRQSSTITGAKGLQGSSPQVMLNNQGSMRYSNSPTNSGARNADRTNSGGPGVTQQNRSSNTSHPNGFHQGPGANPRNRSDKIPGGSQPNGSGKPPGGGARA